MKKRRKKQNGGLSFEGVKGGRKTCQIIMADKDNEWNVPSSDGEEDSSEAQSQGEEKWEVPLKVLLLYSEIEKNGFIELKVKECRSSDGPKPCTVKEQETTKESDATEANADPEFTKNEETSAQNIDKEK